MKKSLSMKEIAELAGVSVATISRVMNQNGGYSTETEEKVRSAIKKYNYVPNSAAKSLRTNRAPIVGIIVPDILNEYYSRLVFELQMAFFEEGYLTMICNTNESSTLEEKTVQALIAQSVSGLILISGVNYQKRSLATGIPTAYIDRRPQDDERGIVYVESDNVQGGYMATKELIECGCTRIAFITDMLGESSKIGRFKGYCNALNEADIPIDPSLTMRVQNVAIDDAFQVVSEALEKGITFDGIMCTTDMLAIGATMASEAAGYKVPEEMKITGFDDVSATTLFRPSITTVHQNTDAMTKLVAELLIDLIDGKKLKEQDYTIPVTLMKRASTRGE
ncbi:MAG: LacI family DNA-binding transcriptional regulator [Lachnospiraceae bacterium]|nr:LacI family DNA-binding transcriptional regulator [Lachnospiraceae bacterium]